MEPVLFDADNNDREKHHQRQGGGDDDLACHRKRVGNKADKVGDQNKEEDRKHQREKPHARLAGGGAHHASDEFVRHFGHGLQAPRHPRAAPRADRDQKTGQSDRQQHVETGIGQGNVMTPDQNRHDGMQGKLVDRVDRRSRFCRHVLKSPSSSASLRGLNRRPASGSAPQRGVPFGSRSRAPHVFIRRVCARQGRIEL